MDKPFVDTAVVVMEYSVAAVAPAVARLDLVLVLAHYQVVRDLLAAELDSSGLVMLVEPASKERSAFGLYMADRVLGKLVASDSDQVDRLLEPVVDFVEHLEASATVADQEPSVVRYSSAGARTLAAMVLLAARHVAAKIKDFIALCLFISMFHDYMSR